MSENIKPTTINLITSAVLIALGIAVHGFCISYAIIKFKTSDRSIVVKGLSEREVKSDVGELILTFKNTGNNLLEIQDKNNRDKKSVLDFLKNKNFNEEEISVDYVELLDRQTSEYVSNSKSDTRYIITNRIKVNTIKVDLIKNVANQMDELINQQVNINTNARYYFTKFSDVRSEMIAEATKSARQAAIQFAQDSGSKVGEIKHAVQGAFSITSPNAEYDESGSLHKKIRVVTTVTFSLLN